MIIDLVILLIVITLLLFIIIIILDKLWKITVPLIMVNMIFIVILAYAFWNVEWLYTNAAGNPVMYSTEEYSMYSFVYVGFFFIHVILFIKAGWESWQEALQTKGQMSYRIQAKENRRRNQWRY